MTIQRVLQWLLQSVWAYPISFGIAGPALYFTESKDPAAYNPAFAGMIGCFLAGIGVGAFLGVQKPSLRATGCWAWVIPAPYFLLALLHPTQRIDPNEFFYYSHANEGLGVFLFTLPACANTGYSLGMLLVRRVAPRKQRV